MNLNAELTLMLIAFIGGILANLLRLAENETKPIGERPTITWLYKLMFVLVPLGGSLLVYVYIYDGTPITAFLSLQLGASAPLILKQLASAAPALAKTG